MTRQFKGVKRELVAAEKLREVIREWKTYAEDKGLPLRQAVEREMDLTASLKLTRKAA